MPLKTTAGNHGELVKGRGAASNPEGRFETWSRDGEDDGWFQDPGDEPSKPKTVIAIAAQLARRGIGAIHQSVSRMQ